MIKQWERNRKKRFYLIIAVLFALILSGGIYAYTYTTAVGTINVTAPTADIATCNETPAQPDWDSVTDNLSENTTCGECPTGDLFEITPDSAYTGDLEVGVYLTNTSNLIKAYQYLNMKLYLEGSVSANETPNYHLLTLPNGVATFQIENAGSDNYTLSVTGGSYCLVSDNTAEWGSGWTTTPGFYCESTQR